MKRVFFITGTDTGAGKTVLAVILTRHLRSLGMNAAALKPVCSGGRDDARKIYRANEGVLPMDQINPWHFKEPIAPSLAARREGKKLRLAQALAHTQALQKQFDILLVEGAGGLLSPLGNNFNSRDFILRLDATPLIAAPNHLGVINRLLLTLEALPSRFQARARVVLFPFGRPDASTQSNAALLAEFFDPQRIFNAGVPGFLRKLIEGLI